MTNQKSISLLNIKYIFILMLAFVFNLTLNSCSKSDESTQEEEKKTVTETPSKEEEEEEEEEEETIVVTDISISSSESEIYWINSTDLNQKIENALNIDYGDALESETEKKQVFNANNTQVSISINFKNAFQSVYSDSNLFNNSVSIILIKEEEEENLTPQPSVELKADGPGDTYELITSVLAPGQNPLETPDCSYPEFGRHIDEIFDNELNANVFRFFIHTEENDDRCINFDRQRNEIKSYGPSPNNLKGAQDETVIYKWKFKISDGFQSSSSFTHLHQLKPVGGSLEKIPMYTLTTRKGSPDKLQLLYAETDDQETVKEISLEPLKDTWVEVTQTIKYSTIGTYEIEIKKVSDDTVLLEYSNSSINNWRPGGLYVRPKWGIYRSLANKQDLRDEQVLFADFSVTELK